MSTVESTVSYRPVTGFPGYRVGDDGSVWTCWINRGRLRRVMTDKWVQMKAKASTGRSPGRAYCRVNLYRDGKVRTFFVHRLVLFTFVGPRPVGCECRHADGDPTNNRLNNLSWGTAAENASDRIRHGRQYCGERHRSAKLNIEQVREIRHRFATEDLTKKQLAHEYGVSRRVVRLIVTHQGWKHIE